MAFDNIRPSGSDTGAPLNLRKRLALIQSYVDVQGKKVVDFGCGTGQYVQALLHCGADVYGIEYDSENGQRQLEIRIHIASRKNLTLLIIAFFNIVTRNGLDLKLVRNLA